MGTIYRFSGVVDYNGSLIRLTNKSCKIVRPRELDNAHYCFLNIGPYEGHNKFVVSVIHGEMTITWRE